MLSLRVALQRVAQNWNEQGSDALCDRCGRLPASKKCPEGAVCAVCAASARRRAWRKRRACVAHSRRAVIVLLVLSAGGAESAAAEAPAPRVSVHDGDTLTIDHQQWRLWGIDAPELGQVCTLDGCSSDGLDCQAASQRACGVQARDALRALVANAAVRCEGRGRSYGRRVGRCYAGLVDIGAEMVRSGLALDFPQYSRGAYAVAEREARNARRGIWAGSFSLPWIWRQERNTHRRVQQ